MTLDAPDFLLEDAMPETGFEFALSQRRRRDAHGFLTAAQQDLHTERTKHQSDITDCHAGWGGGGGTHVGHVGCERGAVEGRLCLERLEHGERLGVVYARRLVLAARDEVRAVGGELQVGDDVHVGALVREHLVARARVEERDFARFVARQD